MTWIQEVLLLNGGIVSSKNSGVSILCVCGYVGFPVCNLLPLKIRHSWVNMDYFLIQLFCQWSLRCLVFIPFYCCLAKWQRFVCEAGFALLSIPGGTLHCVASLYHRWHATICVWGKRTREREYTPSRRPESTPYRLSWLGVQRCCPDTIIHHTYLHANTHSHMDIYYAHAPVEGNLYNIQWGL